MSDPEGDAPRAHGRPEDDETDARRDDAETSDGGTGRDDGGGLRDDPDADSGAPPDAAPGATGDAAAERAPVDELTGPVRRLDGRVRLVWALRGAVVAAVVAGLVGGVTLIPGAPVGRRAAPVAFVAVYALVVLHAVLRYRSWRYQVREDSLYLERGVLTRVTTVVPFVRIQHVDASRSPLERALGLASSVVYTAGARGADVTIPGLTPARADDLQERLKRLAIAAEGEDAV